MKRPTRHLADARCDCGWQDDARGCQGRAAQHHDKTGHEVLVNISIYYGPTPIEGQLQLGDDQ